MINLTSTVSSSYYGKALKNSIKKQRKGSNFCKNMACYRRPLFRMSLYISSKKTRKLTRKLWESTLEIEIMEKFLMHLCGMLFLYFLKKLVVIG